MNILEKAGIVFVIIVLLVVVAVPKGAVPLFALTPQLNATIFERTPTFRWSGEANTLLVDDNPDFTSPQNFSVSGQSSLTLTEPLPTGNHYWKLIGKTQAGPLRFTIQGKAALEVEQTTLGTVLKNTGNVDMSVVVETATNSITGALVVPAGKNRLLPQVFAKTVEAKEHEE